jgi:hypothetical protein
MLGYHRGNVERQASFKTWVRTWSKRWAPAGVQRLCCFFTNRLLAHLVDGRFHKAGGLCNEPKITEPLDKEK